MTELVMRNTNVFFVLYKYAQFKRYSKNMRKLINICWTFPPQATNPKENC